MNYDKSPKLELMIYYMTKLNTHRACFGLFVFVWARHFDDTIFINAHFGDSVTSNYSRDDALKTTFCEYIFCVKKITAIIVEVTLIYILCVKW